MATVSEARRRANEKYNAKNYEEIKVRVSKGKKEKIQSRASSAGQSVNSFINSAIDEKMTARTVAVEHPDNSQPIEPSVWNIPAESREAVKKAVQEYGGELSGFIKDAIDSYAKSYPSIMKLKSMEAELYATQQSERKRVGIEEPEESEKKEDSFSNLSTDEIIEKFKQVGRIRNLPSQNDDLQKE